MQVYNRYRSTQPSGENETVREMSEGLAAHGHELRMLSPSSDELSRFPVFLTFATCGAAALAGSLATVVPLVPDPVSQLASAMADLPRHRSLASATNWTSMRLPSLLRDLYSSPDS